MAPLKASLISRTLFRRITNGEVKGKMHSQFENAINIELEDGYVFNVLPETIPPNSRSLILPLREWHLIQSLIPTHGMPVFIKKFQMEIPTLTVKIAFSTSRLWDPAPSLHGPPITSTEIHRNLEIVSKIVTQSAETGNFAKSLMIDPHEIFEKIPYRAISEVSCEAFRNRISKAAEELFISISNRNFQGVSKASCQLIGLGPGLTPSGDDLLAGVMAAGIFFGLTFEALNSDVERINFNIISNVWGRTTTFSQILLSDASMGEVVRPLGQLLQEILCGNDKALLVSLTRQGMALGESSGRDMLSGIIMGMKAFLRLRDKITLTKQ